jgi:glycosyltransferase involved in cell wall biosynthesis
VKIAVISTTVFKVPIFGYGGLEVIAYETAKGLAAKGHDVSLFAPNGSVCPGVNIVEIGEERKIDEKTAYSGYWKRLLDYEVVIDHSWAKFAYILKMEGHLKAPVLGVCHAPVNTMFSSLPQVEKPCFVCISHDQASHFEALFGREARVAYNGICLDTYAPIKLQRNDRYLFLARYSQIKGADLAIEACLRAGVGLDLIGDTTITGEPEYFAHCQRLSEKESPNWDKNRGKQIQIHSGVTRGNTVWWFSQAHAFLHPNMRFREPMGLAPVEAMAAGLPVIAWKFGALKETVKHGVTGFLVDSLDEMVKAIQSPWMKEVIQSDRDDCRKWASNFSLENMVNSYEALCEEAIATGGW